MCGGNLEVTEDMTVTECEYCGTKQTIPNVDDEKKIKLFERANKLRLNCEFDKAAGVYENIVAEYTEEAEGYWGLILCRYGIEYVDDPMTGKKIPTCHRSSFDSVMDDEDFELVMENSDSVSRAVYREEAKYIEELRKGIIEVSGKEEPYDIFICYKETDENGERTLDSVLAQDVYNELTQKGYRVFFSRISLEDKLGVEYEPYIFAALNSAKIMLAFGTSYDYYNAVWVKNEWSRFLKLMAKDKNKFLIPCFKNVDAYDIPKEFAKLQSQDMGKIGAVQDLLRGIDKLISSDVKADKEQSQENIVIQSSGINGNACLKRGFMAIEDKEWYKATDFFEQVLNMNAEEGRAYWGEFLAEQQCSTEAELCDKVCKNLFAECETESCVAELEDYFAILSQKYICLKVFEQSMLDELFYREISYESKENALQEKIAQNREKFVFADNKLYQRALRYGDAELRMHIDKVVQGIDNGLNDLLVKIETEEDEKIKEIIETGARYFDRLENVLQIVNETAALNAEKNEAAYQADLKEWQLERENFECRKREWQQQMDKYQKDIVVWEEMCKKHFAVWEEQKREYAEEKKILENEIAKLEEEKDDSYGYFSNIKIEIKNKKIIDLKRQLSRLIIPTAPEKLPKPEWPVEPKLREKPTLSLEEKVGKEEVLKLFAEKWNENGV